MSNTNTMEKKSIKAVGVGKNRYITDKIRETPTAIGPAFPSPCAEASSSTSSESVLSKTSTTRHPRRKRKPRRKIHRSNEEEESSDKSTLPNSVESSPLYDISSIDTPSSASSSATSLLPGVQHDHSYLKREAESSTTKKLSPLEKLLIVKKQKENHPASQNNGESQDENQKVIQVIPEESEEDKQKLSSPSSSWSIPGKLSQEKYNSTTPTIIVTERVNPRHYTAYVAKPKNNLNTNNANGNNIVVFYIELKSHLIDLVPFELKQFAFIILAPFTKYTYRVRVEDDDYTTMAPSGKSQPHRRYKCTFEPKEPAIYSIVVSLSELGHVASPKHIDGSPIKINVMKNYAFDTMKPAPVKLMVTHSYLDSGMYQGTGASISCSTSAFARVTTRIPATKTEIEIINGVSYFITSQVPEEVIAPPAHGCKPWGITYCLRTDEIFITVRNLHEVHKFCSTTGQFLGRFGRWGNKSCERLFRPAGIKYDSTNDQIVLADKDNHRICFFDPSGQFKSAFGSKGHNNGEFCYPWGLDVHSTGELIVVADSRNHRVQIFNGAGEFINKYSVIEQDPFDYKVKFNYPRGVCFDASGESFYVSDFNLGDVFVITLDCKNKFQLLPTGTFHRPQGVCLDTAGNVIICDSRNHCIHVVMGKKVFTIVGFGKLGSTVAATGSLSSSSISSRIGPTIIPPPATGSASSTSISSGSASNTTGNSSSTDGYINFNRRDYYDRLEMPIDACVVKFGKIAVLDEGGHVRIF